MIVHSTACTAYVSHMVAKGQTFRVCARFTSVINLLGGDAIVSVQTQSIPITPLSLVLTQDDFTRFSAAVSDRTMLRSASDGLYSEDFSLLTTHAPIYTCRFPDIPAASPEKDALHFLRQAIYTLAVPGSLALLTLPQAGADTPTQAAARACLMPAQATPRSLAKGLAALVGLGEGLTPSGDDFLVGVLSALWFAHGCEYAQDSCLNTLVATLSRHLEESPLISRAFLVRAIAGEFSQPLLTLYRHLAAGDTQGILALVTQLRNIGHSSGSDMLGGMLYGLSVLEAQVI